MYEHVRCVNHKGVLRDPEDLLIDVTVMTGRPINGLTAGTESKAKRMSLSSTQTRQRSRGVAYVAPPIFVKNLNTS